MYLQQENISWKFNCAGASNQGGIWEREIRSVRKILYSLLDDRHLILNDELLSTFLCEAENILNNRPLTTLSDDPNDMTPLTPNSLLLLKSGSSLPPGIFSPTDSYLRKRWKQMQHLANVFWQRWRKEYLVTLQLRRKWTDNTDDFKLGDLVLITDVILPRNQWCVERITAVVKCSDGRIRSAKIKIVKCVSSKTFDVNLREN